ncbi:hypothetical protein [Parasulfitobacter algicola]|uniref:Uncharacterized protein n=1 Tax=Parasulfitobacter algicola TaxID=2614809 RepID=A0ABX2J170_9RHOB|nr:hypothetical protein [Sulfitobacter algicola]NSX57036.1 hypothetical protein [Sulfitobacter algicola]
MEENKETITWPSGEGRSVGIIFIPVAKIGEYISKQVTKDANLEYIIMKNDTIGSYSVVQDLGEDIKASQIFVDTGQKKSDAFYAVISDLLEKIPQDVGCFLEDDFDVHNRVIYMNK